MGENEQGGMLRNVVVLSLAALILTIIFTILLRVKASTNAGLSNSTNQPLVTTSVQMQGGAKNMSVLASTSGMDRYGRDVMSTTSNGDIVINTPNKRVAAGSWFVIASNKFSVPQNAKTVRLTTIAKGKTNRYVHAWLHFQDANGNTMSEKAGSFFNNLMTSTSPANDFTTYTKTHAVPKGAKTYYLTMEARENSSVVYRDSSARFYE